MSCFPISIEPRRALDLRLTAPPRQARGATVAAVLTAIVSAAGANGARATTYPFLQAIASVNGVGNGNQTQGSGSTITETKTTGPDSAFATATPGLIGGSAATFNSQSTESQTAFQDTITFADPLLPAGTLIPVTVGSSLFGTHSETSLASGGSSSSGTSIYDLTVSLSYIDAFGDTYGGGTEELVTTYESQGGVELAPEYSYYGPYIKGTGFQGEPGFTISMMNDSTLFLGATLGVQALASGGGSAQALYQNTAVTNLTSTDSNVQFIGTTGTNYATLSDSGATVGAEPNGLALLLLGLMPLGVVAAARRKGYSLSVVADLSTPNIE